jgi:hypothetical protein
VYVLLALFVLLDIDGSAQFVHNVEAGMAALQSIGLDSYVTTHVSRVDSVMPEGVPPTVAAWTDPPSDSYARTTVHLKDPYDLWDQPTEVAAYLAHEATHVYRYRIDPQTWTDEAAPSSVELVVRWSLRSSMMKGLTQ